MEVFMTLPDKLSAKEFSRLKDELDITQQFIAEVVNKSHTQVSRYLKENGIFLNDYSKILNTMGVSESDFMQNMYPKIKETEIENYGQTQQLHGKLEEILANYERKNDYHLDNNNRQMEFYQMQTKSMIKDSINSIALEFKQQFADYQIQLKKIKSDIESIEREVKNIYSRFDDFRNFQEKIMTLTKEQIDLKIKDYDLDLQKDLHRDYRAIERNIESAQHSESKGLNGIIEAMIPAFAPVIGNIMMNNYQQNQKSATLGGLNPIEQPKEPQIAQPEPIIEVKPEPDEPELKIPDEDFTVDNSAYAFEFYQLITTFGIKITEKDFISNCSDFIESIEEMLYYEEIVYLLQTKMNMNIAKEHVKHIIEQFRMTNTTENDENTYENNTETSTNQPDERTVHGEPFEPFLFNSSKKGK